MSSVNVFSSKSDVAYAELRGQVLSGQLKPGSRLAQYELARSLGMSITPIREAIRRLSSEGLVDLDTHGTCGSRGSTHGRRDTCTRCGSCSTPMPPTWPPPAGPTTTS